MPAKWCVFYHGASDLAGTWPEAHLVRGFKISRDPKFVEKLEDVVGLFMSPPEHALVLCCDERVRLQALDRTQPGLLLKRAVRN